MMSELKNNMMDSGFSGMDLAFASFILRTAKSEDPVLFMLSALTSFAVRQGNVCCDLSLFAGQDVFQVLPRLLPEQSGAENAGIIPVKMELPPMRELQQLIRKFPDVISFVSESRVTPLVFDESGLLYLHRYYSYERSFAERLMEHLVKPETPVQVIKAEDVSERFKNYDPALGTDWQRYAAELSMRSNFTIITGGPGTGKTTVAAVLLALELKKNPDLCFSLCAPTGKAQVRLKEAICDETQKLLIPDNLKKRLTEARCSTINSLLGTIHASPNFLHDHSNPLPDDLVLVDEASMISMAMMSKLLDALRPQAKLIFLGDKDQLSSVEAGFVFGTLCTEGTPNSVMPDDLPLTGHIAELRHNYRSSGAPNICAFSAEMRTLSAADAADFADRLLSLGLSGDLCSELLPPENLLKARLDGFIRKNAISYKGERIPLISLPELACSADAESHRKAFALLDSVKVLCAVRQGAYGVEKVNELLSRIFGLDEPLSAGMPVMVLKNEPYMNLWNGDIGLIVRDPALRVCFPGPEGLRYFPLAELPPWEPAFAMTVHKSQGSGFDNVLFIMPDRDSPILTLELVYTAVTRARRRVLLWANRQELSDALSRRVHRRSGLAAILRKQISGTAVP